MAKILYVEDDTDLAERITQWLVEVEKHLVEHVDTAAAALERMEYFKYELIILDVGLPDMSGLEVLKEFRKKGGVTPVLVLTGQDKVDQKIQGLDAGADDYLTKPFHVQELTARLRSLQRRPREFTGDQIAVGDVEIDTGSRSVMVQGKTVTLKPREFVLLEFLMRHQSKVISPDEILQNVWSSDSDATSETIYTHVKNLRKKLAAHGAETFIRTVHGAGYVVGEQKSE
ncbi:MAG: response regulator transcription factor [Candidatus Melainabacteria bacterium]|nr:response regulator transcription factor [Candidatus Melainabacteria bacterium]